MVEKHKAFNLDILLSQKKLKEIALNLKITEEDFTSEFEKNGLNKNWLKNLSKRQIKNGVLCKKRISGRYNK